ncbi:Putative uncharacterized protein [Lactococcus lactis subsp. lactis A12]|uniref:Uncharacterized protein n=1 Tax=Lactococcus lactis subsp. lactis A12 TaxID=1137134 RepID=S6F2U8_LACLL|nr:Putative uncharacterized protein [Lactococcus lactis subsp. lactis A12]
MRNFADRMDILVVHSFNYDLPARCSLADDG